jgi:YesN/AraC family two-component response regulator
MKWFTFDENRNSSLSIYFEKKETFTYQETSAFRFIFVTCGTAIIELNNSKMVIMAPTVLCLNERDTLSVIEHQNLQAKGVYFDPIIVNDKLTIENLKNEENKMSDSENRDYYLLLPFTNRSRDSLGLINMDLLSSQRITSFMKALELELTGLSNDYWRCRTRPMFMEILFFLQYIWTGRETENLFEIYADSDLSKKVLLYLHSNYEKRLTLKDLTDVFHINRTTLSEDFQKATNMSVMAYLIKLRIYMASTMIKNTELPIAEIMYRTGFNDNSNFGRTFRKHTGCSPSEYRLGQSVPKGNTV